MRNTITLRRVVAGAAIALLGTAGAGAAGASPRATDYGIPPAPDNASTSPYDFGASATVTFPKANATARVPAAGFLSYLRLCTQVSQLGTTDPDCPDFQPPTTSFDSLDNANFPVWLQATGPLWVASPPGAARRYGTFPTAHVSGAPGGRAATADVTITQPTGAGGTVTPFRFDYVADANTLPAEAGTVAARGPYPAVSFPSGTNDRYLVALATIRGKVDVRVANVRVGGRAVDVGPSCRTTAPAPVALRSPAGVYRATTAASALKGKPGGFQPLNIEDPGSIQGSVSIPAFTGCRSGGVDVSALVTAFVSGPRNPVDLGVTRAFVECANSTRSEPCPAYPSSSTP